MDDMKTITSMYQYYIPICENIKLVSTGKNAKKQIPNRCHVMQFVPFGQSHGLMKFNNMLQIIDFAYLKKM